MFKREVAGKLNFESMFIFKLKANNINIFDKLLGTLTEINEQVVNIITNLIIL